VKVLCARAAAHLADGIDGEPVRYLARTFSDGEQYIRIEHPPPGAVWVVANTHPPAENLLEFFFLLDALKRGGAQPSVLFPYFAYARQDRVTCPGEAVSGAVISEFVRTFAPARIVVLHIHGERMREFLPYENIWPFALVDPLCAHCDIVVAPDKGALPFASELAKRNRIALGATMKRRLADDKVEVEVSAEDVRGLRALIVDDMISTGATVIEVANRLRDAGATRIDVFATHGVFSPGARARLAAAPIERLYVTNSLPQQAGEKLVVLDVAPILRAAIEQVQASN